MQRALKIRAGRHAFIYQKMLRNNEEFITFNNSKIDALAKMNAPFGINTYFFKSIPQFNTDP